MASGNGSKNCPQSAPTCRETLSFALVLSIWMAGTGGPRPLGTGGSPPQSWAALPSRQMAGIATVSFGAEAVVDFGKRRYRSNPRGKRTGTADPPTHDPAG